MEKDTAPVSKKEFNTFRRSVNARLRDLSNKVNPMHDYIVDSQGFERGKAQLKKDGSINFDPRVIDIIKWALLIALLALGGSKYIGK